MITFLKFLEEKFIALKEVYGTIITKDNFEGMYAEWLANLNVQKLIDFGQLYGESLFKD